MTVNDLGIKIVNALPALSSRNFRWFWTGQLISLIGTWMQNIGQAWLVLQLTDSAFKLGVVTALQFLPMTLFSLFAGPLVDRFPKRRILLCTQTSLMILALILASLTFLDVVQYWHILILAVCLGFVNTLDLPARQSFVIELVGKKNLMNAIALNSTIFNLGRIVGPAVAGLLIGMLGMATCFYLNALSFGAVLLGLWMIDVPSTVYEKKDKAIWHQIGEGLQYIKLNPAILYPLILLAVISTFAMNFNVLIPVYAKEGLEQNALGFGLLMTSMGIGSLLGALRLAAQSNTGPRMRSVFGMALATSLFIFVLGFEDIYLLSCFTLTLIGFCSMTFIASVNTTIQLHSEDRMRGRVMSVYSQVFGGFIPLGSLFAGLVSEYVGAHRSMTISGSIGLIAVFIVSCLVYQKNKEKKFSQED
jgi:MFS family permease